MSMSVGRERTRNFSVRFGDGCASHWSHARSFCDVSFQLDDIEGRACHQECGERIGFQRRTGRERRGHAIFSSREIVSRPLVVALCREANPLSTLTFMLLGLLVAAVARWFRRSPLGLERGPF